MTDAPLNPDFLIATEQGLRALFPATHDLALRKCQPRLDRHARDFVARSPFVCIGTQTPDGRADVSPRGDPCGFVQVLDDRTLLIPDRPGNNRLDTLSNLIANPAIGLLFMVPGFDDTLRINGRAQVTRDPDVLARLAVNGRLPGVAIVVSVTEVFLHCAKAFRRSDLWNPERRQNRREMPSLVHMILDQTGGAPEDPSALAKLDSDLEEAYRQSMY
ncbi:pyridoxamine 5'-phosphate oxidase family protein [Pseudotabrizicola algicola]|uniref:Pyridoxamine 5'-phosphate oxidase family protein n=1 Tax=Pseudotabrizicola algicola TaxID=2709381 RepID=A0A6B3RLR9_9RHOB|nr:pyridoxamine 5'-phosphate oxidase family protein [Pseudotabrizicola algicola]NEX46990.1 pyridoxamine 5'-phosphate oxidase family protein [Pseudotabrizicola algicola]